MNIYHLYVKTHNITNLKYLGQTIQDPFKYLGSGTYWLRHIKKHGNNVATEIIGSYETQKELKEAGIYYSKFWNIIESEEWANLKIEEGDGGSPKGRSSPMKGKTHSTETIKLMSEKAKKRPPISEEVKEIMRAVWTPEKRKERAEKNKSMIDSKGKFISTKQKIAA